MTDHREDAVEGGTGALTYESTFESLQNPRRRWALRYLTERGRPVRVGDLADQITAWERGVAVSEITPEARKSVYNSLCQTHLPQLARNGIVEYDPSAGTVELSRNARQLARYVPLAPSTDDRWSTVFLATAGVAALGVLVAWVGPLAPLLPVGVVNVAVVGLFFLVSLAYAADVRGWIASPIR